MADFLDHDAEIGVPCPGCGHETAKSIGWLKANDEMVCAGCGETINFTASFRKSLSEAERLFVDFRKGIQ